MSFKNILFDSSGGVARLTLNRPEKLNSFTAAMHEEVQQVMRQLAAEQGVRVLVLTGSGRGFCAGQDLADLAGADAKETDLGEAIDRYYAPLVLALRDLPVPVLCAVNGVAAGAGANLAFACDLVVAKESASFIQSFARLGLMPDTGGTYFLPRLAGTQRAMGLAMLAEKISAKQAAEWGLIWRCVPDEEFQGEVEKLVAQLATSPTLGLARIKRALYASEGSTLEQQLKQERDGMRELGKSADYREGVDAFLEKRAPVFHGR